MLVRLLFGHGGAHHWRDVEVAGLCGGMVPDGAVEAAVADEVDFDSCSEIDSDLGCRRGDTIEG